MKYELNGATLARSTSCSRYYDCLMEGRCAKCEVERPVGEERAFIKGSDSEPCPYKLKFGNSYYCTCPTRIELKSIYGL